MAHLSFLGRREAANAPAKVVSTYGQTRFRVLPAISTQPELQNDLGHDQPSIGLVGVQAETSEDHDKASNTNKSPTSTLRDNSEGQNGLRSLVSLKQHHQHTHQPSKHGDHVPYFPLPADNLLHLIHLNVYRALTSNKSILNVLSTLIRTAEPNPPIHESCTSLCDGASVVGLSPVSHALPPALFPTGVQQTISHSSWMNMFPSPQLRDNMISMQHSFNHLEFCDDTFGEIFNTNGIRMPGSEGFDEFRDTSPPDNHDGSWQYRPAGSSYLLPSIDDSDITSDRTGLIVWGDPWMLENWEITPRFVRKWAWAIEGCDDLIRATNKWRTSRGDEPIRKVAAVL